MNRNITHPTLLIQRQFFLLHSQTQRYVRNKQLNMHPPYTHTEGDCLGDILHVLLYTMKVKHIGHLPRMIISVLYSNHNRPKTDLFTTHGRDSIICSLK